jgi:hypothetical protein
MLVSLYWRNYDSHKNMKSLLLVDFKNNFWNESINSGSVRSAKSKTRKLLVWDETLNLELSLMRAVALTLYRALVQ